ncbi:MAG TPA: chemotaxis protein CheW [Spirochaetia bacterium]|nr:chemotaxis protein CheW [Spirochaetaceae bacterium]HPE88717.1 chemotaxis protein CheW [Spirochaetales bacterium]HRW24870.1 chemotaxis protein CheW [Spirochaetia bacterium]
MTQANETARDGAAGSHQYLRFTLAGEDYAFDVVKAREVLALVRITPLPCSMEHFAGVINLRGSIIPIMDLRKKFAMGSPAADFGSGAGAYIVVIEVGGRDDLSVVGVLVDSVKSVVRFDDAELEPAPKFGMRVDSALIKAIAKRDELFITVLDSDRLFSEKELSQVAAVEAGPAAAEALAKARPKAEGEAKTEPVA